MFPSALSHLIHWTEVTNSNCCGQNIVSPEFWSTMSSSSAPLLPSQLDLVQSATKAFSSSYACPPSICGIAPGRVNIIGEHTDYNQGFVLPMAIPLVTVVVGGKAADGGKLRSRHFGSLLISSHHLVPTLNDFLRFDMSRDYAGIRGRYASFFRLRSSFIWSDTSAFKVSGMGQLRRWRRPQLSTTFPSRRGRFAAFPLRNRLRCAYRRGTVEVWGKPLLITSLSSILMIVSLHSIWFKC